MFCEVWLLSCGVFVTSVLPNKSVLHSHEPHVMKLYENRLLINVSLDGPV